MFSGNLQVSEEEAKTFKKRIARKITKQRLKNIALYYLQRFETSTANLKSVLMRRVNEYAYQNPEWNRQEAIEWIDEIVEQLEGYGYVNDERFAELKIKDYLAAGKSARFIKGKLQLKGINESTVDAFLEEQEYNPYDLALKFAKKKHLGRFRPDEESRLENRQKDMMKIVQAGFDYDVAQKICQTDDVLNSEDIDFKNN